MASDIMVQSISLRLPDNPYVAQHVWMSSNFPNSGISKPLNFQAEDVVISRATDFLRLTVSKQEGCDLEQFQPEVCCS